MVTFAPLGAWLFGLLRLENSVKLLHPVAAIICIGPVSLPIAALALLANVAI